MWKAHAIYSVLCVIFTAARGHDFRNFDDTVAFKINWPGKASAELLEPRTNVESYFITTANHEKYECLIPDTTKPKQAQARVYDIPYRIELLAMLFEHTTCSYRLEAFWTYELCHGRFVRQFHEDREGKKVKTQEYFLGTLDKERKMTILGQYAQREINRNGKAGLRAIKVFGVNLPYVEIVMGEGTICDLNNKPRTIKVRYVCYQHNKQEILSLKEISSCEYEAVVLTPLLCGHPDYKPPDTGKIEINCHPVESAPMKPQALVAMDVESVKLRHQKVPDETLQKVYAIFHVFKEGQDGEAHGRGEIHPVDVIDKHVNIEESIKSLADQGISSAEVGPVQSFLSGNNCLYGGNGWWKYEFCYGRSVVQYHIESGWTKSMVNLGSFDKQKHLDWIAAHPHKKPKAPELRKHLSHFYSGGAICDKTGNPRQTEVKLKCVESNAASLSSVSLFLLEPTTCEYILGVESPLICDILEYADENGLFSEKFDVNFDKLKTTIFRVEQDDLDERIANGDD